MSFSENRVHFSGTCAKPVRSIDFDQAGTGAGFLQMGWPDVSREVPMKQSLRPGISKVRRLTVDRDRTISFMGEDGRVYGTPEFIRDIEHLCRDLLLEHSDTGEDSVGIEVSIKHTAATLLGMAVEITAQVTAVDGRKVAFEVSAGDELEPIGLGTHNRFIVDVAKTCERLKAKAGKRAPVHAG
jgi:predicted thioesterase